MCFSDIYIYILRGAQTLAFLYTISTLQHPPCTNTQGSGTFHKFYISCDIGFKMNISMCTGDYQNIGFVWVKVANSVRYIYRKKGQYIFIERSVHDVFLQFFFFSFLQRKKGFFWDKCDLKVQIWLIWLILGKFSKISNFLI
jgi:hypothetical protein